MHNLQQEYWKDIEGFEGKYKVSTNGQVRSYTIEISTKGGWLQTRRGRILKPKDNGKGYKNVALYLDGKGVYKYIHALVARAFLSNPNKFPEVNHKDLNKANNTLSNLEWVTKQQNQLHSYANDKNRRRGLVVGVAHHHSRSVLQLTPSGSLIQFFVNLNAAERHTGCQRQTIAAACKNKNLTRAGFRWRYPTDEEHAELLLKHDHFK